MEHRFEPDQPLRGRRILVVDDEFMIALMIEETLTDAGAEVVSAMTLPTALKNAQDEPLSAALLDIRLGRQSTELVADALAARDIPFVFYSGQAVPEQIRAKHPNAKVLTKPIKRETFVDAVLTITPH